MKATGVAAVEKAGVAIVIVLGVAIAVVRLTRPRAVAPRAPETLQANVPTPSAKPVLAARGPVPASAPVPTAPARTAHGDRHRTHRAKGRGPARVTVGWKTQVGGAIQAQVTVSPDGATLYAASLGGDLTALARDTGAIRWKLALGDRAYGAPCVADDGTIYVGSDAKRFYAVTPAGAVKWKLELDDEADTAALLTTDGKIVFTAGRTLYAVRSGGDVAWRFQAKKKIFTAPAIADDGTIAFGAQDHRAYRVTSQGVLASVTDLGADVDGSPAIGDDGAIFFGTDEDRVVRLGDAGEVVWRAPVGGFVRGGLSVARDGDVLAGVYGPTPRAVRLDAHDGGIVGSHFVQGTGAREFGVHGGALEDDDGTLYFGAQDDAAYAVEKTGAVRWRFVTGDDVDAPLTLLADGALVVPSDDGIVYLLSP
ncbi:MAG: cell surface protein [Myxococcaceae bacterium]|nr:cell surface protein [Myxococcaceae bacterium]